MIRTRAARAFAAWLLGLTGAVGAAVPALGDIALLFDPVSIPAGGLAIVTLPVPIDAPIPKLGSKCVTTFDGADVRAPCSGLPGVGFQSQFRVPSGTQPGSYQVTMMVFTSDRLTGSGTLQVEESPVEIPDLRGLSYPEEAARVAAAAKLRVCPVHRVADGIVTAQEPAPGHFGTAPRCIVVTVVDAVRVPDLSGLGFVAARARAAASGLVLTTPVSTAGIVSSQRPAAGRLVAVGRRVTVRMKVAVPPRERVPVPDVRTMTLQQARSAIGAIGLVLDEPAAARDDARVDTQSPDPGTRVGTGSHVTVTLVAVVLNSQPATDHVGEAVGGGVAAMVLVLLAGAYLIWRPRPRASSMAEQPADQRRPPDVQLQAVLDPTLDVRLIPDHRAARADLRLIAHADRAIDPIVVEVS